MRIRLTSVLLLAALSALPAMAQQTTRADFNELAKALAGRWVGQVTFVADWPGQGKKGDKVTAYGEQRMGTRSSAKALAGQDPSPRSSCMTPVQNKSRRWAWTRAERSGSTSIPKSAPQSGRKPQLEVLLTGARLKGSMRRTLPKTAIRGAGPARRR